MVGGIAIKVLTAAIGTLARNGTHNSTAPMTCNPGTIRKIPMNRPIATARGTVRRVKRHNSGRRANGATSRLRDMLSRVGIWAVAQARNGLVMTLSGKADCRAQV